MLIPWSPQASNHKPLPSTPNSLYSLFLLWMVEIRVPRWSPQYKEGHPRAGAAHSSSPSLSPERIV